MSQGLPVPEVPRCYFDDAFEPPLPAMCLRWGPTPDAVGERPWVLPEGVRLHGPPPQHFGIRVQRLDDDSYSVRLLWDRTCFTWLSLSRFQLMSSSLAPLLSTLGTDLWYLLDQPVQSGPLARLRAA